MRQRCSTALVVAGCALLLAACRAGADASLLDLSAAAAAPAPVAAGADASSRRPLFVAVAPVITPRENLNTFRPLIEYMSRRLGRPVRYVPTQTYAEINEMLRFGTVDVALVCSYPYVLGRGEGYMELLAFPQIGGQVTHSTYIIVPADSPARSLADLRGKSFAFSDPLSYSGRVVPTYLLWKLGETPEGFFGRTVFTYSHANSLKAVARHVVDGAAVVSAVFDYVLDKEPEYRDKVRVLINFPRTDTLPLVVRADLAPELKDQLRQLFLTAHQDPEGRAALAALRVERFQPPDDRAYDVIRSLVGEMRAGR